MNLSSYIFRLKISLHSDYYIKEDNERECTDLHYYIGDFINENNNLIDKPLLILREKLE